MAIALVDNIGLTPAGSAGGTTGSINTTGANLICVAVSHYAPGGSVVLTDNKSNTYVLARNQNDNTTVSAIALYYVLNPTVGSGHTFTLAISGATGYPSMTIEAFSGIDTGTGLDQVNSSGTATPGSITPGANNSLVFTGASANGTVPSQTFSVNSGFTIKDQVPFLSAFYFGNASAYLIQGTAAAVNPTWSYSAGLQTIASAIISFKPAVATTVALIGKGRTGGRGKGALVGTIGLKAKGLAASFAKVGQQSIVTLFGKGRTGGRGKLGLVTMAMRLKGKGRAKSSGRVVLFAAFTLRATGKAMGRGKLGVKAIGSRVITFTSYFSRRNS